MCSVIVVLYVKIVLHIFRTGFALILDNKLLNDTERHAYENGIK